MCTQKQVPGTCCVRGPSCSTRPSSSPPIWSPAKSSLGAYPSIRVGNHPVHACTNSLEIKTFGTWVSKRVFHNISDVDECQKECVTTYRTSIVRACRFIAVSSHLHHNITPRKEIDMARCTPSQDLLLRRVERPFAPLHLQNIKSL